MGGTRNFLLVALKRQKILPNASMILYKGHPLRYHLQRGRGVPLKAKLKVGGHCDPACTFQWEKHSNKGFLFVCFFVFVVVVVVVL